MYGIINYIYKYVSSPKTPSESSDDVQELEEEIRALEDVQWENELVDFGDDKKEQKNDVDNASGPKPEEVVRNSTVENQPEICQYRVGTVTKLFSEYGVIDEKHHFDFSCMTIGNIREGLRVNYVVFRNSEEENWRVHKIMSIVDENWDGCKVESELEVVKKTGAIDRNIIGLVESRKERDIFVKPNITFCLDDIESDFIPRKGDWIAISALVELDENVQDFVGDVLSVYGITPLRSRVLSGSVTAWDSNKNEGLIDKTVWFSKDECEPGYMPVIEDSVAVEAIESQQGLCAWRALSVVCLSVNRRRENCVEGISDNHKIRGRDPDNSIISKHGLQVPRHIDFGNLIIGELKDRTIEIANSGATAHILLRGKFHGKKSESQMTLLSNISPDIIIFAGQKIICRFRASGKFIGHATEIFVFTFKGFRVTCLLHVNVQDKSLNEMIKINRETDKIDFRKLAFQSTKTRLFGGNREYYMPGVRPIKPPAFIPVKFGQFQVPVPMWQAVLGENEMETECSHSKIIMRIEEIMPVLAADLMPSNYSARFHLLLHLEEIEATIQLSSYDMKGVVFSFTGGEFMSFQVPGLAEKRPSVMVGDKVTAKSSLQPDASYEGYVHKVCAQELWLKFHQKFHLTYGGEECSVHFVLGRGPIRRCHVAVDLALKNLGEHVLFPKSLILNEPQVNLLDDHYKLDGSKSNVCKVKSSEVLKENFKKDVKKDDVRDLENLHVQKEDLQKVDVQNENIQKIDVQNKDIQKDDLRKEGIPKDEVQKDNVQKDDLLKDDVKKVNIQKIDVQNRNIQKDEVKRTWKKSLHTKKIVFRNGAPVYTATGKQYLPSKDPPKLVKDPVRLKWFNSSLNYYQKEAVRNALKGEARPLPYIIFGPPGTGKTITLVETILQIYKLLPDSRILVATPSNSSANLIAERLLLSKALVPGDLVRLIAYHCVEEGTIPELLLPYCTTCDISARSPNECNPITHKLKSSSNAIVIGRHRITVGTCIALGQLYTMGFPSGHFTHVCVDEAGQATEPELLIPLGFLHKDWGQAILAGDPLQLGPVVTSRVSLHFGLGYSYLARILDRFPYQRDPCGFSSVGGYNPKLVTRLVMNYRSVPEILTLPSSLFYDSQLQPQVTYEGLEGTVLKSLEPFLPKRDTLHPPSIVFHGVRGVNYQESDCPSWFNPQELMQIVYYLKDFYDIGLDPADIGVIAPYQKQVQKLRSLLTQLELSAPKIGSVEEFQGQERLVIIMSAVRSTIKHVQTDIRHALGFVACPQRLNVALTRARALLILIGNPHVLTRDPYWKKTLAYCVENDAYVGSDLPRDFVDMAWESSQSNINCGE